MKILKKYILIICLASICLPSCKQKTKEVNISFYHWKSNFFLSQNEKSTLKSLEVKRLYVRFFDVDWDNDEQNAKPIAVVNFQQDDLDNIEIVPTVFITNKTMLNIKKNQIDILARKLTRSILAKAKKLKNTKLQEIQLDCDWSPESKANFFSLLEKIKQITHKKEIDISATIRLHQLKYPKITGVPPVDKGMLMFYNMGNLDGSNSENSILDLSIAEKYLNKKKYKLPLDLALPIYSWGVLKRRGRVINLLNDVTLDDFKDRKRFEITENNLVKITKGTYFNGVYLYPKDLIRIEKVEIEDLKKTSELLRKKKTIRDEKFYVTYYHLSPQNLKVFSSESLKNIAKSFE